MVLKLLLITQMIWMIEKMMVIEKLNQIVTQLFICIKKLNISLLFIT